MSIAEQIEQVPGRGVTGETPRRTTRFASIDFLRGMAIFLMLFLHTVNHVLDINPLLNDLFNIPIINVVALITLPYLGGLAGFFLMVSAIGNMVSMVKYLQKGRPVSGHDH